VFSVCFRGHWFFLKTIKHLCVLCVSALKTVFMDEHNLNVKGAFRPPLITAVSLA